LQGLDLSSPATAVHLSLPPKDGAPNYQEFFYNKLLGVPLCLDTGVSFWPINDILK
jgi:hypothetical protein